MKSSKVKMMVLVLAAVGLSACEPLKAVATRDPVMAPALQEFPATDYYLVNNKMFLWPTTMTSTTVTEAVRIGRRIDDLDTLSFAYAREDKSLALDLADYLAEKEKQTAIEKKIKTLDSTIKGRTTLISTEEKKPVDKQNPANLAKWKAELAKAQTDRLTEAQNLADQEAITNQKGDELDAPTAEAPKGPKRERMSFLAQDRVRVETEGTSLVDRMIQIVDWYKTQPGSMSFRLTGANPVVELNGWDLSDDAGSRNFSSETTSDLGESPNLGTITDITYVTLGGVIRFNLGVFETTTTLSAEERAAAVKEGFRNHEEYYRLEDEKRRLEMEARSLVIRELNNQAAQVLKKAASVEKQMKALVWNADLREVYSFRIARHAYEKTLIDGRLFFAGDLVRRRNPNGTTCADEEKCTRRGSIKLVDRNN